MDLALSEIRQWVERNATALMPETEFAPDELDHLAKCMDHLYKFYHEGYPIGDFLTAVAKNDFSEACLQADNINRKALYLYTLFLVNKIPLVYRQKASGKGAKR